MDIELGNGKIGSICILKSNYDCKNKPQMNAASSELEDISSAENKDYDLHDHEGRGKSRRNRRKGKGGKHHPKKWKPYSKLTWEERKAIDEKESIRANQKREERFCKGQPMAPYNTTQFLMEQHQSSPLNSEFNNFNAAAPVPHRHSTSVVSGEASGSMESSDEYYSSPDDEETFLQKDFFEQYDNFHAERLQTMSKDELVKEYIELELKVEKLEKASSSKSSKEPQGVAKDGSVTDKSNSKVDEELQKLKAENEHLRKENEFLKTGVLNNVNYDNKENTLKS